MKNQIAKIDKIDADVLMWLSPQEILAISNRPKIKILKLDANRVSEYRRRFFENKTDEDFYGK